MSEYEPKRELVENTLWDQILNKSKSIAAFLGALLTFAVTLSPLGLPAWVGSIGVLLTFAAVYQIKNIPLPSERIAIEKTNKVNEIEGDSNQLGE